mmetsp:Transcript_2327/g.15488  ORF Transcript_2327/g.15488 Transcript_2327/m.15488 type:complete len:96 (+) Transcript_2327:70-357(+)
MWQENDKSFISIYQNAVESCHMFSTGGHRGSQAQRLSNVRRYQSWNTPCNAQVKGNHRHPRKAIQVSSKKIRGPFKQPFVIVANVLAGLSHGFLR